MAKVLEIPVQDKQQPIKKNWVRRAWEKISGSDGQYRHIDRLYLLIVLVLLGFGLVMLYSASYAYSYYWHDGNSFYYIVRQLIFAALGLFAMLVLAAFDYRHFMRLSWWIYLVTIALLLIVFLFPPLNNARRWIQIPGITTFQPSEIAKFAIIVIFAMFIHRYQDQMKTFKWGVLPFLIVLGPVAVLVMLEPHTSGTLIICAVGIIMMLAGGTRLRWILGPGVIGGALLMGYIMVSDKMAYVLDRINIWLNPWSDPSNAGFQITQSLIAIGSGGFGGAGLGNSKQKYMYIPEPANDFIFAVVCEELGFLGAALIVILFALLIWRGFWIGLHARETFGGMLAMGISVQIGLQTMLNIMVVSGVVPNTGISLPFFSYGGTSLAMLLAQIGIVLSVSRGSSVEIK